jgi:hypothetical protein
MQVMQMTVEDLVDRANKAEDADERTRLLERASETATKLAPYVHPRLNSIEHKCDPDQANLVLLGRLTESKLIARLLARREERGATASGACRDGSCSPVRAARYASKRCVALTMDVTEPDIHIGASIGIARYPADGKELERLLQNADLALCQARTEGRSRWRCFEARWKSHGRRCALERDLRQRLR